MSSRLPQTLLIDADDTLWENNIFFERVIERVQGMLLPFGIAPDLFRMRLNEAERQHIRTHGYGTVNFTSSLVHTFESFFPDSEHPLSSAEVRELGLGIRRHPIVLLDGVKETLAYLAGRHDLLLVTKGNPDEQADKIERSELKGYFRDAEILAEKDESNFRSLIARRGLVPERSWMVGNSPRSDINPSLRAGLGAVYIPHPHTWVLEHEEPTQDSRLLELDSFSSLRLHF